MSPARAHPLRISTDLDDVEKTTAWLHGVAQAEGIGADLLFRIDLCLSEAMANVVSYAFPEGGRHAIDLELRLDADRATLIIADGGRPFDPLTVPEPRQPASLEEATIGGLGVHLIRHYADECAYERRDDLNVLTLRWRVPDARGPA